MYGRHVTKTERRHGHRTNRRRDRKIFSRTADQTERVNSGETGRPMRGGIRL